MPGDRPFLRSPHAGDASGSHGAIAAAPNGGVEASAGATGTQPSAAATWTSLRNLWQVPTIVASLILIVVGVRSAIKPAMGGSGNDFDGALAQVEQFTAAGQIDEAYAQLRGVIEPHIEQATLMQQARFHAVSGDLTFASQEISGQRSDENNKHIVSQYGKAQELGLQLSPVRLEREGEALLALGDLEGVQQRLDQLRRLGAASDSAPTSEPASESQHATKPSDSHDAHEPPAVHDEANPVAAPGDRLAASESYGRLFRHLIETQLRTPDLDSKGMMELLAEYRLSSSLDEPQRMWVTARLAELRLETGDADAAVDGLLIEMRRLEDDSPAGGKLNFGELYLLLGRGYHQLGNPAAAQENLERALELLTSSEPARGDALVLLGRLALTAGDDDAAYEKFNAAVTEFVGTRSHLPALLGKAECESLLGDHASAQADFRELSALLKKSRPRRDLSPDMIAQRLCDRHDAALAMGKMERALEYVAIAETLFEHDEVPPEVLLRLASTNRQLGEDLLAAARGGNSQVGDGEPDADEVDEIDPAVRYEANRRFAEAGEDYMRHASAETDKPLSDADWGASLWAAAECFDRGGQHRRAIEQFEKYLGSRPPDDPRKAEAMFRVAQAHQALMEYDQAALAYEQVLSDRERSSFAARCHVPLARCYLALQRTDDARQTLQQVLSGERLLGPDARDFRDALIELGRLHHDQREFVQAIERLTEATDRYPGDPRSTEIQYLLADSYRGSALQVGERLAQDTGLSPSERGRLTGLRSEHLQNAERLFASITSEHAPQPGHDMPAVLEDLVRRAHFYQADCAFELAQYDQAVELYESASRQYSGAASSMYALVQIVNCYAALGDGERAAAAHQRALLRLKQLPDSAFAEPDALMDRTAWERWLRNSPVGGAGESISASAAAG